MVKRVIKRTDESSKKKKKKKAKKLRRLKMGGGGGGSEKRAKKHKRDGRKRKARSANDGGGDGDAKKKVRLFVRRSAKRAKMLRKGRIPFSERVVKRSRLQRPEQPLAAGAVNDPYVLFIRHGDDHVRAAPDVRHDTDITERGRRDVRRKARELYAAHGLPDVILASPLLRARNTAVLLADELEQLERQAGRADVRVKLQAESRFGRRFSTREQQNGAALHTDTRLLGVPVHEDDERFNRRVDGALRDVARKHGAQRVWIVTHFLVIKRAHQKVGFAMHTGKKMPFLWSSALIGAADYRAGVDK